MVQDEHFDEEQEQYLVDGYADPNSPIYNEMKKRANENE